MFTQIEPLAIDKVEIVAAGATAVDVKTNNRKFVLQNQHETNTVHIKEKAVDNVAATTSNGYIVYAKETSIPLVAKKLSVIASAGNTTVAIVYLK